MIDYVFYFDEIMNCLILGSNLWNFNIENNLHPHMMPISFFIKTKTPSDPCLQYKDSELFMKDIKSERTSAINCLSLKTQGSIYQIGKQHRLVDDDILELHSDCIMIFIQKVRTGKYVYQGYEPTTYIIEIAKRRVLHFNRKAKRHQTEDEEHIKDDNWQSEDGFADQLELLDNLLKKLSDNCRRLISLKYLEEIKDKDIISNNLTQYSTVDALKNHRSQCLKKLMSLAKQSNFYSYE